MAVQHACINESAAAPVARVKLGTCRACQAAVARGSWAPSSSYHVFLAFLPISNGPPAFAHHCHLSLSQQCCCCIKALKCVARELAVADATVESVRTNL
jgi:hypothetical protein